MQFFVGKISGLLESASMIVFTKEVTDKDRSLKIQLTISSKNSKEKISSESVWANEGFFKDTKPELNFAVFYIY